MNGPALKAAAALGVTLVTLDDALLGDPDVDPDAGALPLAITVEVTRPPVPAAPVSDGLDSVVTDPVTAAVADEVVLDVSELVTTVPVGLEVLDVEDVDDPSLVVVVESSGLEVSDEEPSEVAVAEAELDSAGRLGFFTIVVDEVTSLQLRSKSGVSLSVEPTTPKLGFGVIGAAS
jgi:hypothetical protein